jgi:hypothetical protein
MAFPVYPSGQSAAGTLLQIANALSPETFSTVARISDITGPTSSIKEVDTTSHSTVPAGGGAVFDTWIPTVISGGTISFKLFIKTDNANDRLLLSLYVNRTFFDWKIVEPDSLLSVIEAAGFFNKFNLTSPVAGVTQADMTIRISGVVYFFES